MSFVSVIVCDYYLSVMADSRSSEIYTDGRYHKTLSDDEEKIRRATECVFYAMTGILEDAEEFISKSNLINNIITNNVLKSKNDLEQWLSKNSHLNNSEIDMGYRISFGGLSVDGQFKVYTLESGSNYLEELEYEQGNLSYSLSPSTFWKDDYPERLFISLMEFYDGTVNSAVSVQKELNDKIAELDPSVNTNTKSFVLERKDN